MLKKNAYTPAHLYLDNTPYFITSAIYQIRSLLADAVIKQHLLAMSAKGSDLSAIFRKIHTLSGRFIRIRCPCSSPVWWNFWDYCPRDEQDYLTRLTYLLINPVKHGYCNNLYEYPFSSFHQRFEQSGREALAKQFREHRGYQTLLLDEDDF